MLLNSLCWTLIHSLWEGLLAALAAGIVLLCTRRSSAALRYRLLTGVFFGLVAVVGGTLAWELTRPEPVTLLVSGPGAAAAHSGGHTTIFLSNTLPAARTVSPPSHWGTVFAAFCDTHALLIVSVWFVILIGKLLQTGWSLAYVQRIRRQSIRPAPAPWPERLHELADLVRLRRPVTLLESALIKVPMVAGYLKPIILLPMGILAQLPQDQLEAVLLHELAHIRRRDYLVNILQGLVEAFLFFNPFVWWVSSLIREEREHCCDDIAIATTRSKAHLINALVAFQEYSLSVPDYAVAFPGRRHYLLDRVKRIVYNRNKTLNAMEKLFLSGCLVVAACLTLAFTPLGHHWSKLSHHDTVPPPIAPVPPIAAPQAPAALPAPPVQGAPGPDAPVPPVGAPVPPTGAGIALAPASPGIALAPTAPRPPALPDTLPPPVSDNELEDGTFRGSLVTENGKITRARGIWNNGSTYRYYIDNKKIVRENGVTTAYYIDGQKVPDSELDEHKYEIAGLIAMLEAETHRGAQMSISRSNATGSSITATNGSGTMSSAQSFSATGQDVSGGGAQGGGTSINGTFTGTYLDGKQNDAMENATNPIIHDILDRKLATDPLHMSFFLDRNRMRVNDVTQPKEVFDYFRNKYVLDKKDSYSFSRNGNDVVSTVSQNRIN
jgi:beta-lactamase regulating signal transducer with metallopeptidase domain